jgi:D-glycero-D-manno-heptose 1,7-bisphosphate phosphatase
MEEGMPPPVSAPGRRAVFLDRDGVLNRKAEEGAYITSADALELLAGAGEALHRLQTAGFLLVVATNQRGVARGALSPAGLEEIHEALQERLAAEGARLSAIYVCPHEGGCDCRKPQPGMLLRAADELQLDLAACWMVGDSSSDIEAGRAAGCRTVWIGAAAHPGPADLMAADLAGAVDSILMHEGAAKTTPPGGRVRSSHA